jgi:hypothetical protein
MTLKYAQVVEMSFGVPDSEKAIAKKAVQAFRRVMDKVEVMEDHLNIIYNPFSSHKNVSVDSVYDNRGALIRYKNRARENFNRLARAGMICIMHMNYFSSDTHSIELMKSFVDSVKDIEDQMEVFESVFENFKSKDFRDNVIKVIQGIKKQDAQLVKLINDRILTHINANILATNWQDNLSEELNLRIKEKEPYIKRLYLEREKQLNDALKNGK